MFASLPFWLLLISLSVYTVVGWIVLSGFLPLYVLPLFAGFTILISFRRFYTFGRADAAFGFLLAFVGWAFISAFAARDVDAAMKMNLNWLAGVGLAFYSMQALRTTADALTVLRWYLALHALALGPALAQTLFGAWQWSPRAYTVVQPAGFEGMSFALGKNYLPLLGFGLAGTLWFDRDPDFRYRRLSWLCTLVGVVGVVVSESRSTLVGALCGLLLVLMLRGPSMLFRRPSVKTMAAAIAGLAAVLAVLLQSGKWQLFFRLDPASNPSVLLRSTLFTTALAVFKDHWLLGVGGKNFQLLFFEYFNGSVATLTRDFDVAAREAVPTHNMLLNILISHGIVGAAAFMAGCVLVGVYAWRCVKPRGLPLEVRWIALGLLLFLVMYGIDMQFHNYDFDNNMWLFIGMFLGARRICLGDWAHARSARAGGELQVSMTTSGS